MKGVFQPAHAGHGGSDPVLLGVLALAVLGSMGLATLAFTVYRRHRSLPRLFVLLALSALLARTAVAILTFYHVVAIESHHLVEHGLDVLIVLFVVAATYTAESREARARDRELSPDGGTETSESTTRREDAQEGRP